MSIWSVDINKCKRFTLSANQPFVQGDPGPKGQRGDDGDNGKDVSLIAKSATPPEYYCMSYM